MKLIQDCSCSSCGVHSYSSLTINVLHLAPDKNNQINLEAAIVASCIDSSTVVLNCQCGQDRQYKSNSIDDTGPFLMVALKRAQLNNARCDTAVSTPLDITLGRLRYSLICAVMHHSPISNNGHYTCIVNDDGSWLHCDDSRVT